MKELILPGYISKQLYIPCFNSSILCTVHLSCIWWTSVIDLISNFLFQTFDYFSKHVPTKLLISLCKFWETDYTNKVTITINSNSLPKYTPLTHKNVPTLPPTENIPPFTLLPTHKKCLTTPTNPKYASTHSTSPHP